MKNKPVFGVVGGGSWGTALVKLLQHNEGMVWWWVRRKSQMDFILKEHHNPYYLSHTELDVEKLHVTNRLDEVIKAADVIIVAIPSAFLQSAFREIEPRMLHRKFLINAVKGLEPASSLPVYKWFTDHMGMTEENTGVLGGPCHSEEVVMQRLSYLTLGVFDITIGEQIRKHLETPFLKVQLSEDVIGISISSVLKNVYGILAGIINGLRYGDNFQAVLVANAVKEMEQVLLDISGNNRNINDSVYAGDLLVTSYSRFSRNWMFGNLLGKGYSVQSALLELKMVAEGYYAADTLTRMNNLRLENYPMLDTVHRIIYRNESAENVVAELASLMK